MSFAVVPLVLGASSCDPTAKHSGTVSVDAPDGMCWSGSIGDSTKEACGSQSFDLNENIIVAVVQKQTDGRWTLTATLTEDGNEVDTSTTDAEFGIVTVQDNP